MIGRMEWRRTGDDGEEQTANATEAQPGVVHITPELLDQLMADAGWERVE